MTSLSHVHLYGLLDLDYLDASQLETIAQGMLQGGIDLLQLRAKRYSPEDTAGLARRVLPRTRDAGVPLIINDHPEIAREVDADGVHVGQDDRSVSATREIVGSDRIVGLSTHSLGQARAATAEQVDYIGFGPLFSTPTKPDYAPIGLDDIAAVHREVELPIFCIGGIKRENLPQVLAAGARRVVIVSGILQAPDVPAYIRDCQAQLRSRP